MELAKLIITIPKYKYQYIQELEHGNTDYATTRMLYHAVKNAKPLDTVENKGEDRPKGHWIDREVYDADRWKCSECGRTEQYKENFCSDCGADMRAESKDPNDLTHIFDGVTEIPKDAFKGWSTEEILEQIRKENNDNPEDIGCDHND